MPVIRGEQAEKPTTQTQPHTFNAEPANGPDPNEPPVPVLQGHGFNGGITKFNNRVQSVVDSYTKAYGYKPSPGLVFDLAKSPVDERDFMHMFTVPQNPTAAKNRGIAAEHGYDPNAPLVTTAKDLANGLHQAAAMGTYHQYVDQHQDLIHSLSQNKKDAAIIAGAVFQAKRVDAYREIETKVNNGELSAGMGRAQLQAMGFVPGGSAFHELKGVGGELALGVGQVADSLVHSPAGLYALGKAAGLDTRDIALDPAKLVHLESGLATGNVTDLGKAAPRTSRLVKGMAKQTAQDFEHPGQNPGYLFLDILGIATPIASGGARVAEAGRLLGEGEGLGAATKALGRKAPLRTKEIRYGDHTEEMPLSQSPIVAAAQDFIINRRQAGADREITGERSIPGALKSVLLPGIAGDFFDSQLSMAKKVGREADARKRVDYIARTTLQRELDDVAGRAVMQARMASHVPNKIRGGLTRGEQKAIQVQSWDDPNPLQAERDFHERMIDMGVGDKKAHQRQIADLKLAQQAIDNPRPRFLKALELTQQAVAESERMKIQDLGLAPETAEGRVAKAAQILRGEEPIGGETATSESHYLKVEPRGKAKRPSSANGGYYPVKAGGYGVPLPRDLPELTHSFTGKALSAGDYRIDATSLASESYAKTVRAVTVRAEHSKLWDAASPTQRTKWDIPIRDVRMIPDKLRDVVGKLDEGDFTEKEAASLPSDMRELIEALYPPKISEEEIPHVRWVDRRTLGEGSSLPHVPGLGARVAQTIQSPFRFFALYLRPAYILNKLGNHAMLWMDQGIHTPPNFIKALGAKDLVGEENLRTIQELVGAGKSRSYVTGASGKISKSVAEFWNRVADQDERVTAFIYHAKRKGYSWNQEDITRLLSEENRADLTEVTRRANKSLVEFDNLLPIEKDYIRHWIFVYPWVSRSAVWSIRTILEHPTKTAILSHLGREDLQDDPIFKNAPAWFKRIGYVPIGWTHDGQPKVVNPTSVNSFSTLGDFVAMTKGATVGDKYASAEDFLGPLPKFFVHAATGRDEFGNQYPGSQWWAAAKDVLGGLPQVSAYDKAHPKQKKADTSFNLADRSSLESSLNANLKKTVMSPGWLHGYGSLIGGGLVPRDVNPDALAARYWADQDPKVRHDRELDLLNRALDIQGQALSKDVPKEVRSAVASQANIDFAYKTFLKDHARTPTDKERANFTLDYLKQKDLIPPAEATKIAGQLKTLADPSEINRVKNTLLDKYANGKALRLWDRDVRTVASFTPAIFNEKVGKLFTQGLADQKQYNVGQEKLYDYARKYVAFTHEAENLRKSGASALALKAFQDEHDTPVNGLPSFVRLSWANQTAQDQQNHISSITTQSWATLSGFDKALLGRPSDPKITKGWVTLNKIISDQRQELAREGRTFPGGYARTLAKYVEKYYDAPGLVKDFDFAKQPAYVRLKYLAPIQKSPNKNLWSQVFSVAAGYSKYLNAKDDTGSHAYSTTAVRQMWRDYVHGKGFQAWLGEHPQFRSEIQNYGKNTLETLIG